MPSFRSSLRAALVAVSLVTPAAAETDLAGGGGPCNAGRGSLTYIGCKLAEQLLPDAASVTVTVVSLKSDRSLPAPDRLRERVERAVSSALSGAAKAPQRNRASVELSVESSASVLRVSAELRREAGLWQRARQKRTAPELRAFAEARLDAELRSLIPPPPLVVSETLKVRAPERGIVALACGPLGQDGGQEVVAVTRANVRVGRFVRGAFVERTHMAWSALSPVAPSPLREPVASAEITEQGTLRLGLTDREHGLELSSELSVLRRFSGLLPVPTGACAPRAGLGVLGAPRACDASAAPRAHGPVLDALAGAHGEWFGRDQAALVLTGASPQLARMGSSIGAQLAAGDLDGDGEIELAFSEDTTDPSRDRVTLVTVADGRLTPRFAVPAPALRALALCSRREGPGMAPLILASGDELWVVR